MKQTTKEAITSGITCGIGIGIMFLVGQIVIEEMNTTQVWANGFCADKISGNYDVSKYINGTNIRIEGNLSCILGKPNIKYDATMDMVSVSEQNMSDKHEDQS